MFKISSILKEQNHFFLRKSIFESYSINYQIFFGYFTNVFAYFLKIVSGIHHLCQFAFFTGCHDKHTQSSYMSLLLLFYDF